MDLGNLLRARAATAARGARKFSSEAERILHLPRRDAAISEAEVEALTQELRRPGGTQTLRPVQALAFREARARQGLMAQIRVGGGKTLIALLMGTVLDARRTVLFVPAQLRDQLMRRDLPEYARHWRLPSVAGATFDPQTSGSLVILSHDALSRHTTANVLDELQPDLIVVDEAHRLANLDSSRTIRFIRHYRQRIGAPPMCVFLSGTLIKRDIGDAAHLGEMALHDGSPWPRDAGTLITWGEALNPDAWLADCTDLERLARPGEPYRAAFSRRLIETPGVVVTQDVGQISSALNVYEWPVELPKVVADAYRRLQSEWVRPDGEELMEALEVEANARQLSAGFHYYRTWPRSEPLALRERWLDARKEWRREVRRELQRHPGPGLDSPLLLERAAERQARIVRRSLLDGSGSTPAHGGHRDPERRLARAHRLCHALGIQLWRSHAYGPWQDIREECEPGTSVNWLSDFIVQGARAWADRFGPGIIWVEYLALGQAISRSLGCPYYGQGAEAHAAIGEEKGHRTIVASIDAHGTGKNLQRYSAALVLTPGRNASEWEQLLGRLHREGQTADEVNVWLCLHTPALREAFAAAREEALFLEQIWGGGPQKLRYATYGFQAQA